MAGRGYLREKKKKKKKRKKKGSKGKVKRGLVEYGLLRFGGREKGLYSRTTAWSADGYDARLLHPLDSFPTAFLVARGLPPTRVALAS